VLLRISSDSNSELSLNIGQNLMKIWRTKKSVHIFWIHPVRRYMKRQKGTNELDTMQWLSQVWASAAAAGPEFDSHPLRKLGDKQAHRAK